jgi:hypothetical protein
LEIGKNEHQHFSVDELSLLLADAGFELVEVDGSGRYGRILVLLKPLTFGIQGPRSWLASLNRRDAERYADANLFATFRRTG